ncbi:hypothetical protein MVEN_00855100 [Mycena venus]|uniref:Uncharacterized protein n=1 Tax=Mycena venus TaxID=2733690 RepID=A0A8H6YE61_9AGAR|nr:hypothetical protein MVEN_00855100 [Mycena venus]
MTAYTDAYSIPLYWPTLDVRKDYEPCTAHSSPQAPLIRRAAPPHCTARAVPSLAAYTGVTTLRTAIALSEVQPSQLDAGPSCDYPPHLLQPSPAAGTAFITASRRTGIPRAHHWRMHHLRPPLSIVHAAVVAVSRAVSLLTAILPLDAFACRAARTKGSPSPPLSCADHLRPLVSLDARTRTHPQYDVQLQRRSLLIMDIWRHPFPRTLLPSSAK